MEKNVHKTQLDRNKLKRLRKLSKEIGWENVIDEFFNGVEETVKCEIANRGKKKSKMLKIKEKEEYYNKKEKLHHNQSIEYFKLTNKLLEEADDRLDPETRKKIDEAIKAPDNLNTLKLKASKHFREELIDTDIDPEEATELLQMFDESFDVIEKEGFGGLVKKTKKQINDLIEVRSDEKNDRGRIRHSILLAKALIIAGYLGISLIVVLICYAFHRCVYLENIFWTFIYGCAWLLNSGC
ncbi:hypothetical protein ES705_12679 [subsurface metagenome]